MVTAIVGQCLAMRWSSVSAQSLPTLCVLKMIVLKYHIKNSYRGPLRNSTSNRTLEASRAVVKKKKRKLKGSDEEPTTVPFHLEILLPWTA